MKSSIFIPKTINVGYQNRSDTYTGKLAYVIYYDEKGKLRKEASWNSWRDEKIPNEEFENVPTSGFVLNKKAGGVEESWGWNARKTYCRIYDPRNFEFEITIENLLYILENANSIKGKGLEGEFVYGWDGKDLVLMPVESPDYKVISEYSEIVHNNEDIKAKDLIIGATYLSKDNEEWIYMGKFNAYDRWDSWSCKGKHFWFYKNGGFVHYKSMPKNKLIKCINDKCTEQYADLFYKLEGKYEYCPYDYTKDKYIHLTLDEFKDVNRWGEKYFISTYPGVHHSSFMIKRVEDELYIVKELKNNSYGYYYSSDYEEVKNIFPTKTIMVKSNRYPYNDIEEKHMIPIIIEEIFEKMKPMYLQKYLENGREYEKEYKLK